MVNREKSLVGGVGRTMPCRRRYQFFQIDGGFSGVLLEFGFCRRHVGAALNFLWMLDFGDFVFREGVEEVLGIADWNFDGRHVILADVDFR